MAVVLSRDTSAIYDSIVYGQHVKTTEINKLVTFIRDNLETKSYQDGRALSEKQISHLFFDVLAEKDFDRKLIGHSTTLERLLAENWQKQIDEKGPTLHELRHHYAKVCQSSDSSKDELGNTLIDLIEKEARFALSLGVKASLAGETSTAFFLYDLQGKKIALYKPDDLTTAGKNNPKLVAKVVRWLYKSLLQFKGIRQKRQSVGDVFSYKASGSLGHFMVPPSKIVDIKSRDLFHNRHYSENEIKRGSLQVFIQNLVTAEEKLHTGKWYRFQALFKAVYNIIKELIFPERKFFNEEQPSAAPPELDKKIFLAFALFDFITGQIDRHYENWTIKIVKPESKDEGIEISASRLFSASETGECIVAIDNGASAPIGYVNELEALDQYMWTELSLADICVPELIGQVPLKPGWQESVLEDFISIALAQDLKEIAIKDQVEKTVRDIIDSSDRPIAKKEIEARLKEEGEYSPKLLSRLAKTISQALAIKERIAVIECFIDPPEKHAHLFTLKRLGAIRTQNDYKRFWKEYQALTD